MKTLRLFFLFLSVAMLTQCSSGKKALKHGDYYSAVIKSVNRLRQNPKHKKSKEILRLAYPYALKHLEDNAKRVLLSSDKFKYCEALEQFDKINQMYEDIRRSPGAMTVIKHPKEYYGKADELTQLAALERYNAGIEALSHNTRQDAKEAYYYFMEANDYVSNFRDVQNKMDEALYKATLKVVVEQIPVPMAYSLSSDFFQDQVEAYLHDNYYRNKFVHFYTNGENIDEEDVDQYMRIAFDDFVVGQTFTSQKSEVLSKDSVIVGQVTLEDGTVLDAYNTVTATFNTWHKETISQGLLRMEIFNARNNSILRHEKFDGRFVWVSDWGNYNGDERALTTEQLSICSQREAMPPPPQALFIEFTKPIYNKLTSAISRFYSRY